MITMKGAVVKCHCIIMRSMGGIVGKGSFSCPGYLPVDVPLELAPLQALLCHQSPAGAMSPRIAPALPSVP